MDKNELRIKWDKEREAYKTQEIGSGVQMFVKDVFSSEDIFTLSN